MKTLLHRLLALLSRSRVRLGAPIRLRGNVTISFRGNGKARFRIQHTRDQHGKPYEFGWCDVSALSNGKIPLQAAIDLSQCSVRGMLVEQVNGNQDALYRHHSADWLRVIPFDDDATSRKQCERYTVRVKVA